MSEENDELELLCNRLADGLASEADAERLRALLREGPRVRRRFREFLDLHAALHWDYVAAVPQPPLPRSETGPGGNSGSWTWIWLASAALAMILLIAVGWFAIRLRERATHGLRVATLTAAAECIWEGNSLYKHFRTDQYAALPDYSRRPQHLLPFGEPIRELL
jgi:hypothetical protein